MPNPLPMGFPAPPQHANLDEVHRWSLSVANWVKNTMLNGTQSAFYAHSQLQQMMDLNQLEQGGKTFFNNDSGKLNVAEIDNSGPSPTLVIKEFVTTPI